MRAADLDDVVPFLRFAVQIGGELFQRGDQMLGDDLGAGNVHRGGEGVVGRLAHVHMVVRVNGAFAPFRTQRKPQRLVSEVGDDLVRVHVGAGAGAGLVNVHRKVLGMVAGRDLFRSRNDRCCADASSRPSSRFAFAHAAFKWPNAWITAAGIGSCATGKLSTARAVEAPYKAATGTFISPIVSRSIRKSLMVLGNRCRNLTAKDAKKRERNLRYRSSPDFNARS